MTRLAIAETQFLRGIAAIERYRGLCAALRAAMDEAGCGRADAFAGDDLLSELILQIAERCNDPAGHHGTMVEYMLFERPGRVIEADGTVHPIDSAESLWAYWRASQTGPFEQAKEGTRP